MATGCVRMRRFRFLLVDTTRAALQTHPLANAGLSGASASEKARVRFSCPNDIMMLEQRWPDERDSRLSMGTGTRAVHMLGNVNVYVCIRVHIHLLF